MSKDVINRDAVQKKISYIEAAIKDINAVLEKFNAIKNPSFAEYVNNVKMIDINK
jgi:hypothetical protein